MTLVYGVGYNDKSRPAYINKKRTKEYTSWKNMLERCYSEKFLKRKTSYIGCTVSDNFKNYSYFYDWYNSQKYKCNDSAELDKDLLVKGNKLYSENTCCLIPPKINAIFVKKRKNNGLPVGVSKHYNKFYCEASFANGPVKVYGFDTIDDAAKKYKELKELHVKKIAEEFKDLLEPKVYFAMMNFSVEI